MKHRWQNIDLFMYMYLLIYIYLFIINLNIDFTEVTFRLSGNGTEIQKETQHWKVFLPYFVHLYFFWIDELNVFDLALTYICAVYTYSDFLYSMLSFWVQLHGAEWV